MGAEGVKWVSNNSSPTLTRYHGAAGSNTLYSPASQTIATTYFSGLAPWGSMGRVSLRPDGSTSSRCVTNQTSLQTAANWGDNCYSDTDQTGGEQKLVYVSQFCYHIDILTATQVWFWVGQVGDTYRNSTNTADYTFSASDIHPAFLVGGVAKSGIYVGAYEGYISSSTLQSVAGVTPTISQTIATFRTDAEVIGVGWELTTVQSLAALQLLFILEYASLDSQAVLGNGITYDTALHVTGATTSNGNASYGTIANNTTAMSFRGVENLWGNSYMFIEGLNIKGNYDPWIVPQASVRATQYNSASYATPYVDTAVSIASTAACITGVFTDPTVCIGGNWAFIPSASSGSTYTNNYLSDEIIPATGNRIVTHGGAFDTGISSASAYHVGIFMWSLGNATTTWADVGARLMYMPQ